jgi:hypothetical protein
VGAFIEVFEEARMSVDHGALRPLKVLEHRERGGVLPPRAVAAAPTRAAP